MVVFPIAVPFIIVLMIFRLSMDGRRSAGRLSLLSTPKSSKIITNGGAPGPASSSRQGFSVEHLRNVIGKFERELESNLYQELDSNDTSKRSRSRSRVTANGSKSHSSMTTPPTSVSSKAPITIPGPGHIDPQNLPSLQVRLDPSQKRMLEWMNELKMDKYVTWYPDIANSHAVAICR